MCAARRKEETSRASFLLYTVYLVNTYLYGTKRMMALL